MKTLQEIEAEADALQEQKYPVPVKAGRVRDSECHSAGYLLGAQHALNWVLDDCESPLKMWKNTFSRKPEDV